MTDPNELGAGIPGSPSLDNPDLGTSSGDGQSTGIPPVQNDNQSNAGIDELAQLKANNRALNKALIEARRGSRQQPIGQQGDGTSPFETPEGQYAISLELATGQLSRKLEGVLDLYPELPASEVARIRRNPWAFAGYDSYRAGDVESALLEIEQALLDRAEEINATKSPSGQPVPPTPAQINANPAGESALEATPGSEEDESPWTMPLSKLEKVKNKELAKQTQT